MEPPNAFSPVTLGNGESQIPALQKSLEEMERIGVKTFPRKTPLYLEPDKPVKFNTPGNRIELYSRHLARTGHDPLPKYTPPERPPEGYFHLNYGRAAAHTFGGTINNPLLFELMPENTVWVHPAAAALHGVATGDYVELANPEGRRSNRVRVRVTQRIRPDSIFIVHGYGHTDRRQRLAHGVGTGKFYDMGVVGKDVEVLVTLELLSNR